MMMKYWMVSAGRIIAMVVPILLLPFNERGFAKDNINNSNFFGVGTHFLFTKKFFDDKEDYWNAEKTFPLVKELGAQFIKDAVFGWTSPRRALVAGGNLRITNAVAINRAEVERSLGIYARKNIPVFLTVIGVSSANKDYLKINQEFSDWVVDIVRKYPNVQAIQLHNEPNRRGGWGGTPEEYVEIYREYARKIRVARPDIRIAGGAISALAWKPALVWLNRALDAGLGDFVDTIAIHPYSLGQPPEYDPHQQGGRRFDIIARISRDIQLRAGKKLGLDFTEFGYTTAAGKGGKDMDEITKANYVARSLLIFLSVRSAGYPLQSVSYYDLKDDGPLDDSFENRYGLVSYDLAEKKPAFHVYKDIIKQFGEVDRYHLIPQPAWINVEGIYSFAVQERATNDTFVVMWRLGASSDATQAITLSSSDNIGAPRECRSPGGGGHLLIGTAGNNNSVLVGSRPVWCRFTVR